jgi:hypothetical protein
MGLIIPLFTAIDMWMKETGGSAKLEPVMLLLAESCIAATVSQVNIYAVKNVTS